MKRHAYEYREFAGDRYIERGVRSFDSGDCSERYMYSSVYITGSEPLSRGAALAVANLALCSAIIFHGLLRKWAISENSDTLVPSRLYNIPPRCRLSFIYCIRIITLETYLITAQ